MSEMEVRIEQLPPMRMACVNAFSESPEKDAWEALMAWAGQKGLLDDTGSYRLFGYNNPSPSPGKHEYGYDVWITVGPDIGPEGDVRIVEFPGGLFAVAGVKGIDNIGEAWKRLVAWRENSEYQRGSHQWLEEHLSPMDTALDEFRLDLYLPLAA